MLSAIVTFVDALPLVNYQFQCISHSVYQLCMFPEQYCHSSGFLSECRPCSKDVCDKLHDDDFPLQCRYNCTVGIKKSEEDSVPVFITENASLWFILLLSLLAIILVIGATFPIWKPKLKTKWLEEKMKSKSPLNAKPEKLPLMAIRKDDDHTIAEKIAEENEPTDNEKINDKDEDATTHQYCEQKLQNVNPTDTEDSKDTKNKIVTARDRLEEDNTKTKLPRNDIMLHMAKP